MSLPDVMHTHATTPNLLEWMWRECVPLKHQTPEFFEQVNIWCHARWGEPRDGNILHEALEGHLDYFDGDWQILFNPMSEHEEWWIWLGNRNDRTEFQLIWG
jgi:hypothetical protein